MNRRRLIAILVLAAALLPAGQAAAATPAVVDHVADGDTIQVQIGNREEDVRFIGIDTPEVYGGVECGGRPASASMKRMLKPGDQVTLVRDRSQDNRDYYGRLLRYVELSGHDLGRKQLRKGWAEVYVFDDPFDRLGSYRRAERKAREADRGAWGRCGGFQGRPTSRQEGGAGKFVTAKRPVPAPSSFTGRRPAPPLLPSWTSTREVRFYSPSRNGG